VVKTWASKGDKKGGGGLVKQLRATFGGRMMLAWLAWALLLWYVQHSMGTIESFDPFQILQVSPSLPAGHSLPPCQPAGRPVG
jgi:hypothetical protein